jgi:hypothetical protein
MTLTLQHNLATALWPTAAVPVQLSSHSARWSSILLSILSTGKGVFRVEECLHCCAALLPFLPSRVTPKSTI